MQNVMQKPQSVTLPSFSSIKGAWTKMDTPTKVFFFFILGSLWAVLLFGVVVSMLAGKLVIDTDMVKSILLFGAPVMTALIGALTGVTIHKNAQQTPAP